MNDNSRKRGISLIVLIITIIVMLILVSSIVISGDESREVAKKAVFINDLTTVQDAVKEYYIINGELPTYNEISYTRNEILNKVNNGANNAAFSNQVGENQDNYSNFYLVNVGLLDLENLKYGKKYDQINSLDCFVVSHPNLKIYYLKGVKMQGEMYYSLTPSLTGNQTSSHTSIDNSSTIIENKTTSGRIRAIKGNSLSTNLDLTAIVQLKEGESFWVTSSSTSTEIKNLKAGENIIDFSKVLSAEEISRIKNTKEVILSIKKSEKEVESLTVDFPNLTNTVPKFEGTDTINKSLSNENTITFKVSSNAGIAYLKYDYYKILDELGNEKDYSSLTGTSLDNYIYSSGKTANVNSNDSCTIAVPKNVTSIRVVAVDKAGGTAYATKNIK